MSALRWCRPVGAPERWRLDDPWITRAFGPWTARFHVSGGLHPENPGGTSTRALGVWTSGDRTLRPARFGDLPPAILSEILRAVDLLVSTSAFAVTADDEDRRRETRLLSLARHPLGAMTESRKQALRCALRGMADVWFDARHLRLGSYAIHLATGRVTCDGAPVTIDLPQRSNLLAVPWLPYDEKLLEMIVYTAVDIARRPTR